ncbi:hypothetical protein EUX98_g7297 [Antrodiella citrinella]|uniref:Galactose oxidase-like Early set domain-containing protein n=1 Tax=Antrodiella citrinella TaxID=2447956 RepID=A0A4S4MLU3_9APHY|nr:hypothetical protein EUX98_g7297 [Antrodiella citrinella]
MVLQHRQLSLLALGLAAAAPAAFAQTHKPGSFEDGGNTLVSGMMLFLGNAEKLYILDKSEANPTQIDGHPAMGSVYDIASRTATPMLVQSNTFCASGMHLPNGSYITLGGNGAIGPGGNIGNVPYPGGGSGEYDTVFGDYDGTLAIRVLNPCTDADNMDDPSCQWFDNSTVLHMQKQRWYSAAEALGDGSVAIIGGFVNGGYINRNYPNVDPASEGGAAESTYEFYPSKGDAQVMQFMIDTSGLNAYALTYLMPSGQMLVQANVSTMLWEPLTNVEHRLPDMPDGIVRVYPASGANAMLPLTPANNYTPTVLFCGGSDMPDEAWGNYSWPFINTWDYPASSKCHSITPEPADGSTDIDYVADDDIPLSGRSMGQFIILPDGTMLLLNGGANGTAGYSTQTLQTPSYSDMAYGMSLCSGPQGQPALYDPRKPLGSRWSTTGFDTSSIARLYHSSAMLLPDGSVFIAGSNPNVDVNTSTVFPTTYQAEIFYPSYFAATTRPVATGIPSTISYGGPSFDLTISASSYSGSANDAAANTTVVIQRGGFTTHGMNMGQRLLQLNNTFTVNRDGSYTLHVSQAPPNANLFQPGPAMLFVVVDGIPSNGTFLTVGNGQFGTQPIAAVADLPASVLLDGAAGTGSNTVNTPNSGASTSHTVLIAAIVAAVAAVGIIGAIFGIILAKRRRAAAQAASSSAAGYPLVHGQDDPSMMSWNASNVSVNTPPPFSPYHDGPGGRGAQSEVEFDPYYQNVPRMSTSNAQRPF